jgi:methylglutaconyl-CoA hydratase
MHRSPRRTSGYFGCETASEAVRVEIEHDVARVALHRPEVRNAFNAEMIAELTGVFEEMQTRDDVRAILLFGDGPSFSAGADVSWMQASLGYSREDNVAEARRMSAMFAAIEAAPQPVIARVHGACLGGGMGLVAVCDCVVTAPETLFGFTETKLGIIPGVISAFVLPKIGESWARALFTTGERFGADLAQRIGLVHWIAGEADLDSLVEDKVRELLETGPNAVREAKRLVIDARRLSLEDRREMTAQRIAAVRTGPEGQEGLRAFLEKRRPAWRQPS